MKTVRKATEIAVIATIATATIATATTATATTATAMIATAMIAISKTKATINAVATVLKLPAK